MRLGVALLAVLLAACGVRSEARPHEIADAAIPADPGTTPVARPAAVTVYLVRGDRVVPVRRVVVGPPTATQRLASLARGPDDREAANGLTTALADRAGVSVRDGVAVVALPRSFAAAPPGDRLLAVAQVVLTLTEAPGIGAVRFVAGGERVSVPRPDGSRTAAPVRRADYAGLT